MHPPIEVHFPKVMCSLNIITYISPSLSIPYILVVVVMIYTCFELKYNISHVVLLVLLSPLHYPTFLIRHSSRSFKSKDMMLIVCHICER